MKPDQKPFFCPVEKVIEMLDKKWTVLILWHLRNGSMRFSELQRRTPGITQKMLTSQLRHLEEHRMIHRQVFPEVPPRVEYSLTEHGESFKPILQMINDWGDAFFGTNSTLCNTEERI